ncbi:hypothetical protein FHS44_000325 [Streptosporangium saharense]|uniref:Uncharacterized protein n=1 Tax=Streptosporangium saharense TaxID=1706840 RepID=A0A7W7QGZ1_9ACTN|nr:hypothetical protein [Streptosporangium saharense]
MVQSPHRPREIGAVVVDVDDAPHIVNAQANIYL